MDLDKDAIARLRSEVEHAAREHLSATDADTALGHYTDDAVAVSNMLLFPSLQSLADDVREYFANLKKVNHAAWKDIYVNVLGARAAVFTAKFQYEFTANDDQVTKLEGIWTGVFTLDDGVWKICRRHETFTIA